jgi:hypothetical protein
MLDKETYIFKEALRDRSNRCELPTCEDAEERAKLCVRWTGAEVLEWRMRSLMTVIRTVIKLGATGGWS